MSEHISSQFENDILQINVNLTKMGGICEDNLKKAIKAITKNDSELAEYIIKKDEELNALESEIDDLSRTNQISIKESDEAKEKMWKPIAKEVSSLTILIIVGLFNFKYSE